MLLTVVVFISLRVKSNVSRFDKFLDPKWMPIHDSYFPYPMLACDLCYRQMSRNQFEINKKYLFRYIYSKKSIKYRLYFLTFTTLWANSADEFKFVLFSHKKKKKKKKSFDSSCKLFTLETICMKCQNLFSGKK